ncbi:TetR/AcrR family transcriptional regulator [Levilactobacillus suantsaii]|uniref:TetR/AcrR family transcriptional regulator n=1 Tax=Levilactobacillus suantsaii TaxID=2292255 RepID=A0A4Q0VMP9_9LACO|nr:TetR/AcrR family transcriptional regulator [Levilactobacillus suantsaii]QMU07116.1 TetR/AcrR family transcriptional regulator [Levilactobacillus suantsaii]RXI80111.1 TetR/AcrR family transcriptional regulator [Levilactobacillus suantsaii]
MRADARANQQKILTTANRLFAEQGVANVGMKQLAHEAHIGVGTLYRNYPSKGALCVALIRDRMQHYVDQANAYLDTTTDRPEKQLTVILQGYLDVRVAHEGFFTIIENETTPLGFTQLLQTPIYRNRIDLLIRFLRRNQPASSEQYLCFQADMVAAMLRSRVYAFERHQRHLSNQDLLHAILRLLTGKTQQ